MRDQAMHDAEYNPNDPEFLVSCAGDGELTAEAQDQLDTHLRDSESLRAFSYELVRLDRLIENWARPAAELEWDAHAALIDARIEANLPEDTLARVDGLLGQWGRRVPEVDGDRFVQAVSSRIASPRFSRGASRSILRIGAPLAAAAALTLVATAWFWGHDAPQPFVQVSYQMMGARPANHAPTSGTRVRFDRLPPARRVGERKAVVAMIAMGSSPLGVAPQEDIPPP